MFFSIDIMPPTPSYRRSEIQFVRGNANNLGESFSEQMLASLPRPWLVIEDASHHYAATLAVLRFFGPRMRRGEFIVVEDGNVSDMGDDYSRGGGPLRAVSQYFWKLRGASKSTLPTAIDMGTMLPAIRTDIFGA